VSVLAVPDLRPADSPAEVRGLTRSDVALLVASRSDGTLRSARFDRIWEFIRPGDLLVVNVSATVAAAIPARLDHSDVIVHRSTDLGPGRWVVELRRADFGPLRPAPLGAQLDLPEGGRVTILAPYLGSSRLAEADVDLPCPNAIYLARHGAPIRYQGAPRAWPLTAYQTVFAIEPGSAEMPSAGRPFSGAVVTDLVSRGVLIAPVVLHAGVSSLERDEAPYPERYRVPAQTARLVNAVHEWGGRVIAVGTTVVRALETAAAKNGTVSAAEGWADLLITPERGLYAVDGLVTGWHEPESSHLLMLEAVAGRELLERSYNAAAELGLASHEFGDAHLILP
jgi:S-adenosylmethionine:tRNA ribosyltransferase-isomerase